ncbi:MAG TPA: 3-deoxy-D-manno-octulosonic acid transferase [Terriglobales bacterium]|nr:3-deoxy-D-manno-octulosonic acid transferase [Terriglobales bacterium]
MYLLYSALLGLAVVVAAPWWLARMLTQGKYRAGLGERMGRVPARLGPAHGCIWVHAVSVGELLAVTGLVAGLRARFPDRRVLVSTTTETGQKLARQRFGEERVFYYPLDFGFAIRPYLRALRPSLIVLAESEFWPNLLRLAHRTGARIAVVNARVSDRSLPRYLRLRALWRRVLRDLDIFLAQSEEDARRLVAIGAPEARVRVGGNLKFDVQPEVLPASEMLRRALAPATAVVVCGSTAEGEEPVVLRAFGAVLERHPRATLILAPRRPERFDAVAGLLAASGLRFWRRSQLAGDEALAGGVVLLDTIGELAALYSLASVAFVGGSLVPRGGHNILEPAQFGVATLVGPHTENFRDIIGIFERAGAVKVVTSETLDGELLRLLDDADARQELGRRAAEVVRQQRGATERTLDELEKLLTVPVRMGQHEHVAT